MTHGDTPTAPHFVAALEPPSPDRLSAWHEQTELEVDMAYHAGYHAAVEDIAVRRVELSLAWARTAHTLHRDRVAERTAEMAATAAAHHAQHGTTEWAGLEHGATLPSADWGNTDTTGVAA